MYGIFYQSFAALRPLSTKNPNIASSSAFKLNRFKSALQKRSHHTSLHQISTMKYAFQPHTARLKALRHARIILALSG